MSFMTIAAQRCGCMLAISMDISPPMEVPMMITRCSPSSSSSLNMSPT